MTPERKAEIRESLLDGITAAYLKPSVTRELLDALDEAERERDNARNAITLLASHAVRADVHAATRIRAEAAESKLRVAVEALRKIVDFDEYCSEGVARAALREMGEAGDD